MSFNKLMDVKIIFLLFHARFVTRVLASGHKVIISLFALTSVSFCIVMLLSLVH